MKRTRLSGLIMCIALACAVGAVLLASGTLAAGGREPIIPVKSAQTQEEAIKLAQEEDLPAMALADMVIVAEIGLDARSVRVKSKSRLRRTLRALIVEQVEPAGGQTKYTFTFYRGNELIRKVWVHPDGEWTILRPDSPYWALGRNDKLVDLADDLLEDDD
jgi:hypothetical protein